MRALLQTRRKYYLSREITLFRTPTRTSRFPRLAVAVPLSNIMATPPSKYAAGNDDGGCLRVESVILETNSPTHEFTLFHYIVIQSLHSEIPVSRLAVAIPPWRGWKVRDCQEGGPAQTPWSSGRCPSGTSSSRPGPPVRTPGVPNGRTRARGCIFPLFSCRFPIFFGVADYS